MKVVQEWHNFVFLKMTLLSVQKNKKIGGKKNAVRDIYPTP